MKKVVILIAYVLCAAVGMGQSHTISGFIRDASSGEALIGANVLVDSAFVGTATNTYGFYSVTLPAGQKKLIISYVGFEQQVMELALRSNQHVDFELKPFVNLEGVEVVANSATEQVQSTRMSTINVPIKTIKSIPALAGEVDVIKAIQLLPGVQSGTEGASGLYVRGGGPDQNLILLDGVPVYNANHLFGFFSVFNADAINNIELIKGGFPARYGGRLSSVLDISMKEGNMKEFHGEGSIGLISSKLTLEGPIIKDRTSFIVSGRRTYMDVLAQPLIKMANDSEDKTGYFFYDLNAKLNHVIGKKDRLYLSVYTGSDDFYQKSEPTQYLFEGIIHEEKTESGLNWGNLTSALRWNHLFNEKLFANTTLTYSNYQYNIYNYSKSVIKEGGGALTDILSHKYYSGIQDFGGRIDFDYIPHPEHYVKFGAGNTFHMFSPGVTAYKKTVENVVGVDSTADATCVNANELFMYVEDDYKVNDRLKINAGIHYSAFLVDGKYYHALQPRLSARYLINDGLSLKASVVNMQQYIHLLSNNTIGLPTDLWVPSTNKIKPQNAWQGALGITKRLPYDMAFSVEGYYKLMENVIEYKDGSSFMKSNAIWEDKIESGHGWSYGVELFLEKRTGNLHGWIGYTWAHSKRDFIEINEGNIFPYKYDRRHDVSVVLNYKIDDVWDVSASWVYGTGTALTLQTVRYNGEGEIGMDNFYNPYTNLSSFENRNDFRMAPYHRMDIGFKRTKEKKWGQLCWNFGLYNAYNRKNPFFYRLGYDKNDHKVLKRISIFPILPSAGLSFKF